MPRPLIPASSMAQLQSCETMWATKSPPTEFDGDYLDNRRPSSVDFTKSLEEDLKRRDFTINAMAYNEEDGVIDLFGGQKDLKAGIVRCVGVPEDRFNEDALRMMRAIRFAARFGFEIDEATEKAIKKLGPSHGQHQCRADSC